MFLVGSITLTLTQPVNAAESTIAGRVYERSGAPLGGVRVILDGPVHVERSTDAGGRFVFRRIPAGAYVLHLSRQEYEPLVVRDVRTDRAGAMLAHLTMDPVPASLKVIGSVVARERLPFNTTPAALKVFPREAYRDQGQAALASVLDQTPGAIVARSSSLNADQPLGPYSGTIRGGLPWETATLIDGNPIVLPSSGSFDLAYVPSFVLQDVEVVKGYGSAETTIANGIDGALNLRTAEPGIARKALLEVEGDDRGGQFTDLAYGGTAPGGRFSFATMLSIDGNPGPVPHVDAAGAALQRAQLLKAHYQFSPAASGTVTYLGSQGTLGTAVARGFSDGPLFASFANSADAQETHRLGLYSLELHADAGADHLTAKAYRMRLQRTGSFDPFVFPGIGSGLSALDDLIGFSLQDDRQVAGNLYQVQFSDHNGYTLVEPFISQGAHTNAAMLRASAQMRVGALTDLLVAAAGLWLPSFTPVVRAGAAFHPRSDVTLRVSAGTGAAAAPAAITAAQSNVIAAQTPVGLPARVVAQAPNPGIAPETSLGYDAGLEYRLHGGTSTLSVDVYRTTVHGAYVDSASAQGPVWQYRWANAPPMTHEGVEFSVQQFKRVGLGFIAQASLLRTYVDSVPPGFYGSASDPLSTNLAVTPGLNVNGGSPFVPGANDIAPMRVPYAQGYAELELQMAAGFAHVAGRVVFRCKQSVRAPRVRAAQCQPRTLAQQRLETAALSAELDRRVRRRAPDRLCRAAGRAGERRVRSRECGRDRAAHRAVHVPSVDWRFAVRTVAAAATDPDPAGSARFADPRPERSKTSCLFSPVCSGRGENS